MLNLHLAKVERSKAVVEMKLAKELELHVYGIRAAWGANIQAQIEGHKKAAREHDAKARIYAGRPAAFYIDEEVVL